MILLLFFSLVSAFADEPGRLRGALDPGPSEEILVHRATGKFVVLRSFGDRLPLVCELMLKGGESAAVYGLDTLTGLKVEAQFTPAPPAGPHALHGWVRTRVEGLNLSLYPHGEFVDTLDTFLEAPYDATQLGALNFSGPIAEHLPRLLREALRLEGPNARGTRTFAAHGKFDLDFRFALEGASVLVKNFLSDASPFLTVIRGRILRSPSQTRLVTPTGRWLTVIPGPALGNVGLEGEGADFADLRAFEVMTLMGLQVGGELRLLRILGD